MRIAVLGLGRMGRELVAHIIAAGHDVTVWNRSTGQAQDLAAIGARQASSPADAVANAELVVTVLFGPETVREVVLAGDLPFAADTTWVDITTVAPADARTFATWADTRGIGFAHSPVLGSLGPARAGQLGVLLGGSSHAVEVAHGVVSLWAEPGRLHVYDTAEQAAAGKLVANLALAVSMQGMVEALRLGHAGGLSTQEILSRLLDKSMLQPIATIKGATVTNATYDDTQFSVDALTKDLGLMINTAGNSLPAVAAAQESLRRAIAAGFGAQDISAVARNDA